MQKRVILLTYLLLLGTCQQVFSQSSPGYHRGDPRNAANPAIIQTLDLSYSKLNTLDSSILRCSQLQTLDLRGNDIIELPEWLSELKELKTINLAANENFKASSLKHICELELRVLVLSSCNLVYLPERLTEIQSLEELDLSDNLLQTADAFLFEYPSLRALVLRSNNIDSLGTFSTDNNVLEWLDISGNPLVNNDNQIKKLDRLLVLKHLGFQGCIKLPSAIGGLGSLTSLDIRNSNLKDINQAITNLVKLEKLNMSNCPNINYTNAFTVIGQLKTLRYLELGYPNSKATVIPDQIRHLKQLRTLVIDNGMQVDLNSLLLDLARLPELKELRINGGKYESLPNEIFRLTKLEKLDFSGNQCKELPFELNNMKHLRLLDIRGNQIERDRIENLQEALDGYCDIKSDLNYKASPAIQRFTPLVSNALPSASSANVNAETGGDVDCAPGVKVVVPPGALLLPNGEPAKGNVTLKYRNMNSPLSFALSGISMSYDSFGYEYQLSSAAMFELQAEQNGQPLKIAPGKTLQVSMPGRDLGKLYNVYQYDPTLNTWIEKPQVSKEGAILRTDSTPLVRVQRPMPPRRVPKETFRLIHTRVRNDQTFTFSIRNYLNPSPTSSIEKSTREGTQLYCYELRAFTGTTWIYDGKNANDDYQKLFTNGSICSGHYVEEIDNEKKRIAMTVCNDIRIKPNPDGSDNFLMEFYKDNELLIAVPVLPLKYANDPYSIQKRINRQYRRYSHNLNQRIKDYDRAEAKYNASYAEFEAGMERFREYARQGLTQKKQKKESVMRTLELSDFGIWNHDVKYRMKEPKVVRINEVLTMDGTRIKPDYSVLVDFTFCSTVRNSAYEFYFDMGSKNTMLFVLGPNKIGVLYDEELKKLATEGLKEARVKVIDCEGLTHEQILLRIGI